MEFDRLLSRRRSLAYLLVYAAGLMYPLGRRHIIEPRPFDISAYIDSKTQFQLKSVGLSLEEAGLVISFYKDVFDRSFGDYEELRVWLLKRIIKDYNLQRLIVHQRCILSHTELGLLNSNFPTKLF